MRNLEETLANAQAATPIESLLAILDMSTVAVRGSLERGRLGDAREALATVKAVAAALESAITVVVDQESKEVQS